MRKLLLRILVLGVIVGGVAWQYPSWRETQLIQSAYQAIYENDVSTVVRVWKQLGRSTVYHDAGYSLLSIAVVDGRPQVLEALLKLGADPNAPDREEWGRTPLAHTVFDEDISTPKERATNEEMARLLLRYGADINGAGALNPPLHYAVRKGSRRMAEFFLKHGAAVDGRDVEGRTPLMVVYETSRSGQVPTEAPLTRLLLQHGAKVNAVDPAGRTPLMHAARQGADGTAQVLMEGGADLHARDAEGRDALIWATVTGGWESAYIADVLLKAGADVNTVDASGRSALSYAAEKEVSLTRMLLKRGADPSLRDRQGKTALDYARQHRRPGSRASAVRVVEEAMAKKR